MHIRLQFALTLKGEKPDKLINNIFTKLEILQALSPLTAEDFLLPRTCGWTEGVWEVKTCTTRLTTDHDATTFREYLNKTTSAEELSDDQIDTALRLVCCKEHFEVSRKVISKIVLVCKQSTNPGPTFVPGSSIFDTAPFIFESETKEVKNRIFELAEPSPVFDSNLQKQHASLGHVSHTRELQIRPGRDPKHVDTSIGSAVEGQRSSAGSVLRGAVPVTPDVKKSKCAALIHESGTPGSPSRIALSPPSESRPLSSYAEKAWLTMEGDRSYDRPVKANVNAVIRRLLGWRGYTDRKTSGKPGWVYIVRDPELGLVKIGYTQGPIHTRLRTIANRCKATFEDWVLVHDLHRVPVDAFKLLEKLVHADLAPHRYYFRCACKQKEKDGKIVYTKHQEWFNVTDKIAVDTLQLWRDFLLEEPFDFEEQKPVLQKEWHLRLDSCKVPLDVETHDEHEMRLQRWERMFADVSSEPEGLDVKNESMQDSDPELSAEIDEHSDYSENDTESDASDAESDTADVAVKSESELEDNKTDSSKASSVHKPGSAQIQRPYKTDNAAPLVAMMPTKLDHDRNGSISEYEDDRSTMEMNLGHGNGQAKAALEDDEWEDASSQDHGHPQHNEVDSGTESLPRETSPLEHLSPAPTVNTPAAAIDNNDVGFDIGPLKQRLVALLVKKRPALPERTIIEDLISLRWPLACLMAFALHGPYVPATLSVFMWTVFLPFFIAELRGWY
ncbi:hypothetical protein LTS10_011899 [Elasticomyces elasticus]|nr:hypothetical protein LTS10_011899 [Elasticomyces elasticus]